MTLSNPHPGKKAILDSFSLLKASDVELITKAIDQQINPDENNPIAGLGKIARKYNPIFGRDNATRFAEDTAAAKQTLQTLFAVTKAVQSARGDLSRSDLGDDVFEQAGNYAKTVKELIRNLKDFGVYVDAVHHCNGLHISPQKSADAAATQPLQRAISNLALTGKMWGAGKEYFDNVAAMREAQKPGISR